MNGCVISHRRFERCNAASRLGLGGLKQSVKNVIQFIPNTVDSLLRRIVSAVATRITAYLPGSGTNGLYAGLVGSVKSFTYQGQAYTLWVAKPSSGAAQVKIAQGTNLVTVLTANMLDIRIRADARNHFADVLAKADLVRQATNPRATALATANLMAALTTLEGDINTPNVCTALTNRCFAAGTKLWTPIGYRAIEDIRPGEPIYSRSEYEPNGRIEEKMVEDNFVHSAPIFHLHVGKNVIRTTGEHPFYEQAKGWTNASLLRMGDRLLMANGGWQTVGDVLETGQWEPVYNLRVSDHHTYFVGDYGWPSAIWAHNLCTADFQNVAPGMLDADKERIVAQGNAILVDIESRYASLNIKSIVETRLLRNGGQYYDNAIGLVQLLRKIRGELGNNNNRGTYNAMVEAANRIMLGHRVSIENSISPVVGKADIIDHSGSGLAIQMKTVVAADSGSVNTHLRSALNQLFRSPTERPPTGYALMAWLKITNSANSYAGMTTAAQLSQALYDGWQLSQSDNIFSGVGATILSGLVMRFEMAAGVIIDLRYSDLQP